MGDINVEDVYKKFSERLLDIEMKKIKFKFPSIVFYEMSEDKEKSKWFLFKYQKMKRVLNITVKEHEYIAEIMVNNSTLEQEFSKDQLIRINYI